MITREEFFHMKKNMLGTDLFDWFLVKEKFFTQLKKDRYSISSMNEDGLSIFVDSVGSWFLDIIIDQKLGALAGALLVSKSVTSENPYYEALVGIDMMYLSSENESLIIMGDQFRTFEDNVTKYLLKLDTETIRENSFYITEIIPRLSEKHQTAMAYRLSDMSSPYEICDMFFDIYSEKDKHSNNLSQGAQHVLLKRLSGYELNYLFTQTEMTSDTINSILKSPIPERDRPNLSMGPDGIEYTITD